MSWHPPGIGNGSGRACLLSAQMLRFTLRLNGAKPPRPRRWSSCLLRGGACQLGAPPAGKAYSEELAEQSRRHRGWLSRRTTGRFGIGCVDKVRAGRSRSTGQAARIGSPCVSRSAIHAPVSFSDGQGRTTWGCDSCPIGGKEFGGATFAMAGSQNRRLFGTRNGGQGAHRTSRGRQTVGTRSGD